jgi:hypothetical protein
MDNVSVYSDVYKTTYEVLSSDGMINILDSIYKLYNINLTEEEVFNIQKECGFELKLFFTVRSGSFAEFKFEDDKKVVIDLDSFNTNFYNIEPEKESYYYNMVLDCSTVTLPIIEKYTDLRNKYYDMLIEGLEEHKYAIEVYNDIDMIYSTIMFNLRLLNVIPDTVVDNIKQYLLRFVAVQDVINTVDEDYYFNYNISAIQTTGELDKEKVKKINKVLNISKEE